MAKPLVKAEAIKLRKLGYTYGEILKQLTTRISKSTLTHWFKNIELSAAAAERIASMSRAAQIKGFNALKTNRERELKDFLNGIRRDNKRLVADFLRHKSIQKVALAMLYLGEGAKWRGHRGLQLGSSEPLIVGLYIKLLEGVYKIPKESLKARVSFRSDQDIRELNAYWAKNLGLSIGQFYKSKPDTRSVGKKTLKPDYRGVCVISCAGTAKQLELETLTKLIFEGL